MAKVGYGKGKSGGFSGNQVKIGGPSKKLALKSSMQSDSFHTVSRKKGGKQAHKKV